MSDDQPTVPQPQSPQPPPPVPPAQQYPGYPPQQYPGYPPQQYPGYPPAQGGAPRVELEHTGGDPWAVGHVEVLDVTGSITPAPRGRRGVTALVAAGVAVVLVGGAAAAWAAFNGDTADQPEKHLPAATAGFVKADLSPSGSQKIDAVRFFSKFPFAKDLQGDQAQDPKRFLYERLSAGTTGAPPWSEVQGWLGNRAAVGAVVLDGAPVPVAVLQVTDDAKARSTFAAHTAEGAAAKVADGWAVVSDTQAHVDAVTAATGKGDLADDATFRHDTEALGDPGVLAGWADLSRLTQAAGSAALGTFPLGVGAAQHVAFVGRFTGGNAEISLRTFGSTVTAKGDGGAGAAVGALPADTVVAVGVTGGGDTLRQSWSQFTSKLPAADRSVRSVEKSTGLRLPGDIADLLGTRFALALAGPDERGQPVVGVRAQSATAASSGALDRLLAATDSSGVALQRRDVPGGYVLSSSREQAQALTGDGGLGGSNAFHDAVPGADDAQAVFYLDVERLAARYGNAVSGDAEGTLKALKAVGMSASATDDGYSMTVRVTTR